MIPLLLPPLLAFQVWDAFGWSPGTTGIPW